MSEYEYQVRAKGYTEEEPRLFPIRTSKQAEVGSTFVGPDGVVWLVGDVDGELLWCAPWFFQRTKPLKVEFP